MSVQLIVDGTCDISSEERERLGLECVPLRVFFGDDEYVEGRNMTAQQFYTMLAASPQLPKTAQITPAEFENAFRPFVDAGDEIVVLPISRELSGTYNSAIIASRTFPDASIYVIDTLNVTFAQALLIYEAAAMRDRGLNGAEIAARLSTLIPKARLLAVIDDLKYLKLGGRLSAAGAVAGTLLGIKPIVTIEGGKVVNIHKVRGQRAAYEYIAECASKEIRRDSVVHFAHSNDRQKMQELIAVVSERITSFQPEKIRQFDIGPVVGTYAGPGCTGIAYFQR